MNSSKHERDASDDADPTSKHAKSENVNASSTSNAAATPSLAGFWQLPQELRTLNFDLACHSHFKADKTVGTTSGSRLWYLDSRVVAKLALVSRDFYSTFNPLLYSRVRLTRPSILKAFAQGLLLRPSNAELVESLHLGPGSDLTKGWWPVSVRGEGTNEEDENDSDPYLLRPVVRIKTSLTKGDEAKGFLPRWAQPDRDFGYEQPAQTCQERAAASAIKAAINAIGVNPSYHLATDKGEVIGIDEWTIRLFELQAVLDLYLGFMKRVEENNGSSVRSWRSKKPITAKGPARCRFGRCGHYPSLVVSGFHRSEDMSADVTAAASGGGQSAGKQIENEAGRTQKESADEEQQSKGTVEITRKEVEAHLARPGAYTDHFEHPIMYARTSLRMLGIKKGRIIVDYHHKQMEDFYGDDESELEYMFDEWDSDLNEADSTSDGAVTSSSVSEGSSHSSSSASRSNPSSVSSQQGRLAPALTMDPTNRRRTYALTREVLRLTTKVKNLSVTGYFDDCLTGLDTLLAGVLYLSIGPLAPPSAPAYWLRTVKLPMVENFRLCGQSISTVADELARYDGEEKWPSLKTVQWDFGGYSANTDEFFEVVLNTLQGKTATNHASPTDLAAEPVRDNFHSAAPKEDAAERSRPQPRRIEARLAPALVTSILAPARTPEVRSAWMNGAPVSDAPHVVHLVESRAAKKSLDGNGVEQYKQDISVLRRDSRLWWEERAEECSRGRGDRG